MISMECLYLIAIMTIAIPYLLIFILILIGLNKLNKELQYKREHDEKLFVLNYKIDDKDMERLDSLIKEEITKYTIINFEHDQNLYIKEKDQNRMIKETLKNVMYKLSPIIRSKLEYVYNKEVLEDMILEKIKFSTMDYVIEVNGEFKDDITP